VADKPIKLSTSSFRDVPICELCLEDALKAGAARSAQLKPQDFKETSIRFSVNGLLKWYKSYAKHYGETSVYTMFRDLGWYVASYCVTNDVLVSLVKEYYSLLKDITENTDYDDLAERMDESKKIEKIGFSRHHCSLLVPLSCHGVVSDCAAAIGTPFSIFYQLELGMALIANQRELYGAWGKSKVIPLFEEVIGRAEQRLKNFREIRGTMEQRQLEQAYENGKS